MQSKSHSILTIYKNSILSILYYKLFSLASLLTKDIRTITLPNQRVLHKVSVKSVIIDHGRTSKKYYDKQIIYVLYVLALLI